MQIDIDQPIRQLAAIEIGPCCGVEGYLLDPSTITSQGDFYFIIFQVKFTTV